MVCAIYKLEYFTTSVVTVSRSDVVEFELSLLECELTNVDLSRIQIVSQSLVGYRLVGFHPWLMMLNSFLDNLHGHFPVSIILHNHV